MKNYISINVSGDTYIVAAFQYMLEELSTKYGEETDKAKSLDRGRFGASIDMGYYTFKKWTFMFERYITNYLPDPTKLKIEGTDEGAFPSVFELQISDKKLIEKQLFISDVEDELMDEGVDAENLEYEEVLDEAYGRIAEMEGEIIQEEEYTSDEYDCIQKIISEYWDIADSAEKYCEAIMAAHISNVYVRKCFNNGVEVLKCETMLPSVDMYKQQALEFNNQKHKKGEGIEIGQREFLLYNDWVITKNSKYAKLYRRLFNIYFVGEIKQSIEEKNAVYITETVKASLLGGVLTKKISARETDEKVYIVHFVHE